MDALTPAGRLFGVTAHEHRPVSRQVSLLHAPCLPSIPSPTTRWPLHVALTPYPSARAACSGLRLLLAGSSVHYAESCSSSYGLVVHLPLLPTPPRGDAVTVGYRPEKVCLKRTCTSSTRCTRRRTSTAAPGCVRRWANLRGHSRGRLCYTGMCSAEPSHMFTPENLKTNAS